MSETQTLSKTERNQALSQLAGSIREGVAQLRVAAITVGQLLNQAAAYFNADEGEKYQAWMQNTSGLGRAMVARLRQVARTVDELPKSEQGKVAGWSVDSLAYLTALDPEQRSEVIAEAGKRPTTDTVKSVRDRVKPPSERNREDAAAKTVKQAEELRETVASFVSGNPSTFLSIIFGAQLVADKGKGIIDALHYLQANPVAPAAESSDDAS